MALVTFAVRPLLRTRPRSGVVGFFGGCAASLHTKKALHSESLTSQDLEGVAKHLQTCRHVVVMVGAGMSVAAGIPDFRTPGTGLYDNLQQYGLPYAEAIFDLRFFRTNPWPFYTLCKEIWPGQYRPTLAHFFITLLHRKGHLQRCFTQNIDSLESLAGLPTDKLVAAHGNFDSATCLTTSQKVPIEEVRDAIAGGRDAITDLNGKYGGLVKPDIVFFGENLPSRFFEHVEFDFPRCDLLIVLGTSLQVQPFAGLVRQVSSSTPRLLINRERVGEDDDFSLMGMLGSGSGGFQFDSMNMRDVFFRGDCDAGVVELVSLLGWDVDFKSLCKDMGHEIA